MDNLNFVVAKESVYRELEKQGLDSNDFLVTMYKGSGSYNTFRGRIFFLSLAEGPVEVGFYQVLITQGEFFPESDEAQVILTDEKISKEVTV